MKSASPVVGSRDWVIMSQSLDQATVEHVARLARLRLGGDQLEMFRRQLSSILSYMEQLNEPDTADVPPTAHPLPLSNVFREDEIRASWEPQEAMRNAPSHQDDFFKVPKVLDQEAP